MYDCCILVCTTFRCRHFPKKTESTFLLMVVVIIKGNVCVSDRFVTKNCEKINREVREVHFWGTLLRRLGAWPRASGCVYFFGWSPSARAKLSGRLIEKRAKSARENIMYACVCNLSGSILHLLRSGLAALSFRPKL